MIKNNFDVQRESPEQACHKRVRHYCNNTLYNLPWLQVENYGLLTRSKIKIEKNRKK